jgi:LysR family nitrogen assimilation transcriptional regulator
MELRQLESLVAIADGGSFSRAAVTLNLTQPSLSRQIALLEQELGQRLLVRTGRGVELTSAGEVFIVHAREMLDTARRGRDAMHDLGQEPAGRVTVGMPPRVAMGLSVPLVRSFRERFPRAVITVLEGLSLALRESLVAGKLDLALLFDPQPSPQLSYEPLMREQLLLVAPPRSHLPARVSLASLSTYPLVLPSAPNAIRGLLDDILGPRGVILNVLAEVGAVQTVLALVRGGRVHGIARECAGSPPWRRSLAACATGPAGHPQYAGAGNAAGTARNAADPRNRTAASIAGFPQGFALEPVNPWGQ